MENVKVQKKDGRFEDFDRNKILNGIVKSGATAEQAENVTAQVEAWVPTASQNGVVRSAEIKNKVLEILRSLNPQAAASFETYKKQATATGVEPASTEPTSPTPATPEPTTPEQPVTPTPATPTEPTATPKVTVTPEPSSPEPTTPEQPTTPPVTPGGKTIEPQETKTEE